MNIMYFDEIGHYQVNIDGKRITRDRYKYPYCYEEFVIFKSKKYKTGQHSACYSDRLLQWDWDKHNNLCLKHFSNKGQYWDDRNIDLIEKFLQDYFEKPNLELVGLTQGCNVGNGYPYWVFYYNEGVK